MADEFDFDKKIYIDVDQGAFKDGESSVISRDYDSDGEKVDIKKKKTAFRDIAEWVLLIVLAVGAALLVRIYVFEFYLVSGSSMDPTLAAGERLFVNKINFNKETIERYDIIICHYPNNPDNIVKRVIGLPGDTIEVRSGTVYLNGAALDEDYVVYGDERDTPSVTLKDDEFFVMGDNRAVSLDSRSVGPIPEHMLVGHVGAVVWPVSEWQTIPEQGE